jgi:transmembrane 9 superfamily protein 2/4
MIWLVQIVAAFYLPGVPPKDYHLNDNIPMVVNALSAEDSLIAYDYYHPKFGFCKPSTLVSQRESLGAILFGDRLFNSPFVIPARETVECASLCTSELSESDSVFFYQRIKEEYIHNWFIDGLPVAQLYRDNSDNEDFYNPGFPIGVTTSPVHYPDLEYCQSQQSL